MKSWCKTLLAAGLSLSLLAACSSSDVVENPVSELKEFNAKVFPEIIWSAQVGDGVGQYYSRLQPTVRYNKIFAADRHGLVEAFDEQTGELVWQQDFSEAFKDGVLAKNKGARLAAGLTAARDKVFVGSESGVLAALNADDGKLVWHAMTDGELLSLPTVAEDVVVVNTGSGALEAFDVDSGKHLWSYESMMPSLTLRGSGSAAYEAGGFFVGTAEGKVAVIVKNNGQPAWEQAIYTPQGGNEFSRMADVDMTPLIIGDNLYAVSYNGNLVSMELRSGRILWSRKYSSFHDLAVAGVSLFLVDDHSRIYSVDRRNGMELWSNSELSNRRLTAPVVYKDYVVVGDFDGYLHFLNRSNGEIVGRIRVDSDGLYSSPVVADGKLYVQSRSGKIVAVTLP
ncbi:outer membrane protein assembly factor BamB [Shewanella sp. NFH-SH190041]|uniref:outer membrane protein assembly factor BamB n=1 Tax=Shewanella sp. NFH-SH190041 TaxID=2950245 RepID=UPI0021C4B4DB|nr:outer membrane protein assembly factor BamB [Shewanella sp. NFH-SH190041]BDM65163.1 outer membrane protein assembly factor BamB [Shewanella sp. NFH-SH190041]